MKKYTKSTPKTAKVQHKTLKDKINEALSYSKLDMIGEGVETVSINKDDSETVDQIEKLIEAESHQAQKNLLLYLKNKWRNGIITKDFDDLLETFEL